MLSDGKMNCCYFPDFFLVCRLLLAGFVSLRLNIFRKNLVIRFLHLNSYEKSPISICSPLIPKVS